MGLFKKKNTKQQAQALRRDGIVDRIDGLALNWKPAFAYGGADSEASEQARSNLVKARGYIGGMLFKDDGRIDGYMDELEKLLSELKNSWYTNSGGRDKVAEICAEVWRIAREWASL